MSQGIFSENYPITPVILDVPKGPFLLLVIPAKAGIHQLTPRLLFFTTRPPSRINPLFIPLIFDHPPQGSAWQGGASLLSSSSPSPATRYHPSHDESGWRGGHQEVRHKPDPCSSSAHAPRLLSIPTRTALYYPGLSRSPPLPLFPEVEY
jgi:hypothetical protein